MPTPPEGAPPARPDPTRRRSAIRRMTRFRRRHGTRRVVAVALAAAAVVHGARSTLAPAEQPPRSDTTPAGAAAHGPGDSSGDDSAGADDVGGEAAADPVPLAPTADERTLTLPLPLAPPLVAAGQRVELVAVTLSDDWLVAEARVVAEATVVAIGDDGLTVVCDAADALDVVAALATGTVEVLGR